MLVTDNKSGVITLYKVDFKIIELIWRFSNKLSDHLMPVLLVLKSGLTHRVIAVLTDGLKRLKCDARDILH